MGAISLIPLLMSVALLSRTALDMTREGNNQRKEERPASYRSHNVLPAWGKKILQEPPEAETDFSDHQVNLADFYRQEAKRQLLPLHASNLIKSRKLVIDDSQDYKAEKADEDYEDQIAMETELTEATVESVVAAPEFFKIALEEKSQSEEEEDELDDFQVPDQLSDLEDQIAMESLDQHLKKITQLPSGLKHKVESDLIRKLTTVEPKPKILTGSGGLGGLITGTVAPDIFIKHKGTPSSDQLDFEPRLDPREWNKHFSQKKALRFALNKPDSGQTEQIQARTRENNPWDSLRRIPEKPSLKQYIKKYSATTISPRDIIRKYEKIRRTTSPSLVLKRKYPANQYAGQDSEEEDAGFSKKYTTASTFRNKNTTQTPAASKELQSEQKYFSADSIEIKVPSFSSGVKPQSYKDQLLTQQGGFNNYKTPKAFHTTLVPVRLHKVSVAPTNMIHLDNYYNRLQEHNKYQDPLLNTRRDFSPTSEDSPSIGQSLKDLFFPSTKSNRRVIKIKKPMAGLPSTTLKPFFSTLSTLKDKLSFTDKKYSQSFPYVFQKPIEAPSSRIVGYEEFPRSSLGKIPIVEENDNLDIDKAIDKQLISPSDPDIDFTGMLSTVLPVLMTLGAGLGVALHSILTNWSNYINIGQIPSLKLDKGGVSIAYDPSGRDLIPIQIDDEDNINLGLPDGRRIAFSFKDPELVNIIINLLPAPLKAKVKNLDLKMDKFVLLRVLLTYLSDMK